MPRTGKMIKTDAETPRAHAPGLGERIIFGALIAAMYVVPPLFMGTNFARSVLDLVSWPALLVAAALLPSRTRIRESGLLLAAMLWTLFSFVSIASSEYPFLSHIESMRMLSWIAVALIAAEGAAALGARFVSAAVALSGLLPSAYGLFLLWGTESLEKSRLAVEGTFGLHNPFAGFLLACIPLAVCELLQSWDRKFVRMFWLAVVIIECAAFVLTLSRAAWLVAVLMLLVSPLALKRRENTGTALPRRGALGGILFAAFVCIVIFALKPGVAGVLSSHAASTFNKLDYSLQGRLTFWRGALRIFADNPVAGTGSGTFGNAFMRYQPSLVYYSTDPHSFPLKTLSEQGTIGFLLFAAVVWFAFNSFRAWKSRAQVRLPGFAALAALGLFVHSLVDFDLSYPPNAWILISLCALAAAGASAAADAAPNAPNRADERGSSRPSLRRAGIAAIAAVLMAFWLRDFGMLHFVNENKEYSVSVSGLAVSANAPVAVIERALGGAVARSTEDAKPDEFRLEDFERIKLTLEKYDKVARAHFLLAAVARAGFNNPRLEFLQPFRGSEDSVELHMKAAIELDPHNSPEYYWEYASFLEGTGRAREARDVLSKCLLDAIPIVRPVSPDFVRPTWIKYNGLFGAMWEKLAQLERQFGDEALAADYEARAREFSTG
ncbi:MAG: O-antigen ligase family protein [bacterium]|jgi:O-antigen ligase